MKKLLIICGPTATGKTSLGIWLSEKFNGEILSVDSRQVYQEMNIGTGKDIPPGSRWKLSKLSVAEIKQPIGFWKTKTGIKIWGYDLVKPDEEFSIAHFISLASVVLQNIWKKKKLPIIVGGSGLYLKSATQYLDTINIPPDKKLRKKLEHKSTSQLQELLKDRDPQRFKNMNRSDRNNPRRLIRAVEIADYRKNCSKKIPSIIYDSLLWIGLTAPKKDLYKKIDERVDFRINKGLVSEIKNLLENNYSFDLPSMSALGYADWRDYFQGIKTKKEVIQRWKMNEHAYAQRQLTWFKNNKDIIWFNINHDNYQKEVVELVSRWYS